MNKPHPYQFSALALIVVLFASLACNFSATPTSPAVDPAAPGEGQAPGEVRATGEPNTGPTMVEQKFAELGGEAYLGAPVGEEMDTADGNGRFRDYENGSIYWSADTGAHVVVYRIRAKWTELGRLDLLGYPLTDELPAPDERGRYNQFQNGWIYWSPETNASAIYGAIYNKWRELGGESGFLGYPTTDERDNSNGHGRHNVFQHGAIYWSAETGAHEIHGVIFEKWQEYGWEDSWLGLPISDEEPSAYAEYERQSLFEHGVIYWHPNSGAVVYDEVQQ